ncbi:MAG: Putative nucleoside-diphosphate-sugar epimerase, partial [uncultured Nocardioidaceae bacterium]
AGTGHRRVRLRGAPARPGAHCGRARRACDDQEPGEVPRCWQPGLRRRAPAVQPGRRAGRLRRGLLPRPLPRRRGLRATRRRGGLSLRGCGVEGGRAPDHLPRRTGQRLRPAVPAPAQPTRGRGAARFRRRAGDHVARRDRCRAWRGFLGDHPPARRPPPGHGHPTLGAHADTAHRAGGHGALPGRCARARRDRGPGLRGRRTRGPRVPRDAAAGRGDPEAPDPHRARPGAVPAAVFEVAVADHRCRHPHRPSPGRLDDQRGRGGGRQHPQAGSLRADGFRRGGGRGLGRPFPGEVASSPV